MSFSMGDIGTLAHTSVKDTLTASATHWVNDFVGAATTTETTQITVSVAANNSTFTSTNGVVHSDFATLTSTNFNDATNEVSRSGSNYMVGTCGTFEDGSDAYLEFTAYVVQAASSGSGSTPVIDVYYAMDGITTTPAGSVATAGSKANHIAVEFNVGGLTPWLGHLQSKQNGLSGKSNTAHYGLRDPLGDTGLNFVVSGRQIKDAMGMKTNPWYAEFTKSLGGGALVYLGH